MGTTVEELRASFYAATAPTVEDVVYGTTCPVCREPIRLAAVKTRGRHTVGPRTSYQSGPVCLHCYGLAAPALVMPLAGEVIIRPCERCRMPVGQANDPRRRRWTCSEGCRAALWKAETRSASRNEVVCEDCGAAFTPPRADAHYCSPACRQRAYRRRHREPLRQP